MQERTPLDRPEQELESALASLTPAPVGIGGDVLVYQARLAQERHRANRWRAAAAIAILAAGAALAWRPRPGTVTVDRMVVVQVQGKPAAPRPVTPTSDTEPVGDEFAAAAYLRLRDALVQNGPQSLPATAAGEGNDAAVWRAGSPLDGAVAAELWPHSQHTFMRGG
jgi:hypothetical protein